MNEPPNHDVIDNTDIKMASVLNERLPLIDYADISTGYFNIGGYGMIRGALEAKPPSFRMRLLLGKEPVESSNNSQFDENDPPLKEDLDKSPLESKWHLDTDGLIRLLGRPTIEVRKNPNRFNHAKCYILGPNAAIIGSSNLTRNGLEKNSELNAGLYQGGATQRTQQWFDQMWKNSKDCKQNILQILMESKFGVPAEPYRIYMKMLFEMYRYIIGDKLDPTIENSNLTKFQKEAVTNGLLILKQFNGLIIADATGLGKTNMALEVMHQKSSERSNILLVAPSQVLNSMWNKKLAEYRIWATTITSEKLGHDINDDELRKYHNIDFVVVDESQYFRSRNAKRRENLMKLMSVGKRKQVLLLTATPINNSLMDLYYQLSIITRGDDSYFHSTVGIPDLYQHMRDAANRDRLAEGLEKIQQLLDRIMIRRTRTYIKEVYPDDAINKEQIKFPEHRYRSIKYSISELFGDVFDNILCGIDSLTMSPYKQEWYNHTLDDKERKKRQVLAHLVRTNLLKRFESSVVAVHMSLKNMINLYKHAISNMSKNLIIPIREIKKILQNEDVENYEKLILEAKIKTAGIDYDMKSMIYDAKKDLATLERLRDEVSPILQFDKKVDTIAELLVQEKTFHTESKKVLIFTEFTDTATHITKHLRTKFPDKRIECITGGTPKSDRLKYITEFAPQANITEYDCPVDKPIDLLVSTDVLAEGQNLQDCNYVINYDLPWNPMKIVQRIGRVDRLTSKFDVIYARACYPDDRLNDILKLMGKLIYKIQVTNEVIGLDTELLGESPLPKQYSGTDIERITKLFAGGEEADKTIIELERESDLMPETTPFNELGHYLKHMGIDNMKKIPMGRRSGKHGGKPGVILAYRQGIRVYFVRYNTKSKDTSILSEHESIKHISCKPGTKLFLPIDNKDSFKLLQHLHTQALDAIRSHNDQDRATLSEMENRPTKFKQAKNQINKTIRMALKNHQVTLKDGQDIYEILENATAWQRDILDILEDYELTKNVENLVGHIRNIGKHISSSKHGQERKNDSNRPLKLIGAMFIEATPNWNLSKNNLDGFVGSDLVLSKST